MKRLVWFEEHDSIVTAIQREKSLKKYKREWKVNLIELKNPTWADLYPSFFRAEGPLSHLQPPDAADVSVAPHQRSAVIFRTALASLAP